MPTSRQETQRQAILHLWNNGVCKVNEINNRTNIPLSTIYDNIKKLRQLVIWIMLEEMAVKKKLLRNPQELWGNIYAEIRRFQLEH